MNPTEIVVKYNSKYQPTSIKIHLGQRKYLVDLTKDQPIVQYIQHAEHVQHTQESGSKIRNDIIGTVNWSDGKEYSLTASRSTSRSTNKSPDKCQHYQEIVSIVARYLENH